MLHIQECIVIQNLLLFLQAPYFSIDLCFFFHNSLIVKCAHVCVCVLICVIFTSSVSVSRLEVSLYISIICASILVGDGYGNGDSDIQVVTTMVILLKT